MFAICQLKNGQFSRTPVGKHISFAAMMTRQRSGVGFCCVKDLKGSNQRQNDTEKQYWGQHGNGHMPEFLHAISTINLSGFIQVGINRLQAAQQQDHIISEGLPNRNNDNGHERSLRACQPGDLRESDGHQKLIERTFLGMKNQHKGERRRNDRQDDREENDTPKEPPARNFLIQNQGKQKPHSNLQDNKKDHEGECDPKGFLERGTVERNEVIFQTDEGDFFSAPVIRK